MFWLWLSLLTPLPAEAASSFPPCVHRLGKKFVEPPNLEKLKLCQKRAGSNWTISQERKRGSKLPKEIRHDLKSFQKAEREDYQRRNGAWKKKKRKGGWWPFGKKQKGNAPAAKENVNPPEYTGSSLFNFDLAVKSGQDAAIRHGAKTFKQFLSEMGAEVHPDMKDLVDRLANEGAEMSDGTKEKLQKWLRIISGRDLSPGTREALEELDRIERGV